MWAFGKSVHCYLKSPGRDEQDRSALPADVPALSTGVFCRVIDLIRGMPPSARVLDLGSRSGSFQTSRSDIVVVRLDLEVPPAPARNYCRADAARIPFASGCFAAVISNHSLEHFVELDAVLSEIGRVLAANGALYVAVPDAGTFSDRVYRWLGRGGGHVNPFRSAEALAALIEKRTGLACRSYSTLYSSLSFLNAHNFTTRPPRKIALFGFGNERFLAVLVWTLRLFDRWFGTGLSRYGWAFYFGSYAPVDPEDWINVCVRCGSGHSGMFLMHSGTLPPRPGWFTWYRCPACGGLNLWTHERRSRAARPA